MKKSRIIQGILLTLCAAASGAAFFIGLADNGNPGIKNAMAAVAEEKDPIEVKVDNPIKAESLEDIIENVINFFFTVAIIICPLIIIIGGFMMVTSGGDPGKVETGKKMVYYALIGLGIVVLAKGFVLALRQILNVKKT
ncbi:MAG TPA: hypothetical protein P5080_03780 [Candidatus Paceibacterota bacterium]|nr:hypothetical protein [Candidatus Pacearchaeota archaeon]HRZ51038.1 hypothetical protein [Candidatus Paceibacterota bacterium]HSA36803.1 hypothetical protein [Candidatus Paceibacterota bacterium]